ncbi:hypothetical protein [Flavobacterium sp. PL12]|uniref:hypothetical protein n=1 Tax=Flavobacterium sp. PL12 TaxID=3071718 RepID=UPI00319E9865
MGKYLGLDLGTDSIGWAIIDNDTNQVINSGVNIYNYAAPQKRYNFLFRFKIGLKTLN